MVKNVKGVKKLHRLSCQIIPKGCNCYAQIRYWGSLYLTRQARLKLPCEAAVPYLRGPTQFKYAVHVTSFLFPHNTE